VKNESDELLQATGQLQSELGSICREHERALSEHNEARHECIIAQQKRDAIVDQMKEATFVTSWLAEENR
jgi:hypothetical protein